MRLFVIVLFCLTAIGITSVAVHSPRSENERLALPVDNCRPPFDKPPYCSDDKAAVHAGGNDIAGLKQGFATPFRRTVR